MLQYRTVPSRSRVKSVFECVCLSMCMCVGIMLVCVFLIQGSKSGLITHPSVCPSFSHSDLFFIFFSNQSVVKT